VKGSEDSIAFQCNGRFGNIRLPFKAVTCSRQPIFGCSAPADSYAALQRTAVETLIDLIVQESMEILDAHDRYNLEVCFWLTYPHVILLPGLIASICAGFLSQDSLGLNR